MPQVLEGTHDAGGHEMAILGSGLGEQIEPNGVIKVAGVEIHRLLRSGWWDVVEQFLRQISMRINEADSMPLLDELEDEVAQERRLPGTRFSDDVDVVAGIAQLKTERRFTAAPRLPHADVKVIVHAHAAQASRRSIN